MTVFKPVSSRVNFPQLEKEVLQFWREREIFARTERERDPGRMFVLFEGPPTANGRPGIHHVLARVFKDVIPRYKTMKGYWCLRKAGWDTHGLPVELEVEKELGLRSKRDIEQYGIERFNQKCRESVFRYVKEWEAMTERIAYWVHMEDPYLTLDNSYIETGWWILKQLWDAGLIYQGMKGTPHCPRCVTSLSSHEVAQGYEENTPDPSVFVKFRVEPGWEGDRKPRAFDFLFPGGTDSPVPTYLLAWTTTPWTLPGNTALAVAADAEYSLVELEQEGERQRLVLATELLEKVLQHPYHTLARFRGGDLVGLKYQPLYDPERYGVEVRQIQGGELGAATRLRPRVISTDFVSLEDGTGIVHIAPAFGDEDLSAGRQHGLAFIQQVDPQGLIVGTYPFAGKFVKEADNDIIADLKARGLLYRRETYYHTYPFCWRCGTPLLYYAKSSWYIRTTAVKDRLVSANQEINWYPEYIKEGRFGEWLRNNVDWAISRERYWGTPIPFWRCQACGHYHCVGSVAELKAMALPHHRALVDSLDLHRPYVDEVLLQCPQCRGTMRRIPEVMDVWYDSGSMPLAQWHYPFENASLPQDGRYPADYICEAVDQTRGWFYSLHAIATLLEHATGGKIRAPSYRNVICLGHILDEEGQKMSKSRGNVVDPWTVLDAQGADALRWYLLTASAPGDARRFSDRLVGEVVRRFLLTLWNTYSFFVMYANIDGWGPAQASRERPAAELDRWILSELNLLVSEVDQDLAVYNPTDAGRRIETFVDLLSNWYVRRSRRRFWKSESDQDKVQAYTTLYTCLVTLSKLLAPFMPFVAEEIYRNLVARVDEGAPESVHLAPFPESDPSLIDERLMEATRLAMRLSSLGRAARAKAGIKVRQPLPRAMVRLRSPSEEAALAMTRLQVLDELNVKELVPVLQDGELRESAGLAIMEEGGYLVAMDTSITPQLAMEGLARELVHRIQNLRRDAGFELTDHIKVFYQGSPQVREAMEQFAEYVCQETLADALVEGAPEEGSHQTQQKLEGQPLTLAVKRV